MKLNGIFMLSGWCRIDISVSFLFVCFLWLGKPVKGELEPTTLPPCLVPTREQKVLHAPSETDQAGINGKGKKATDAKGRGPANAAMGPIPCNLKARKRGRLVLVEKYFLICCPCVMYRNPLISNFPPLACLPRLVSSSVRCGCWRRGGQVLCREPEDQYKLWGLLSFPSLPAMLAPPPFFFYSYFRWEVALDKINSLVLPTQEIFCRWNCPLLSEWFHWAIKPNTYLVSLTKYLIQYIIYYSYLFSTEDTSIKWTSCQNDLQPFL